ncbi:JDVT-CTERM system glutamic-type intramembrane protease MrtJ [Vibrio comitans]|uniref:CAAX prenyl protease 2/Lysostaphin resistance protein A-like domain-containing protein n=1 Tax=Vibrio comitans NBRC 102076 TaxID=1219078 RepID=A0A4Y3INP0_9VIBR|nr:JDVT-CTERM system glutamic-type intramembrane protease [Vibrio comitans]GEA60702.1 hypothetical protein VCO01S_18950 [Vibrio comitans NBRC 102076]
MQYLKSLTLGALDEFALRGDARWILDRQFKVACLFGLAVGLVLLSSKVSTLNAGQSWQALVLVVLVSPLLEELLFRGMLQGRLLSLNWGSLSLLGFTSANLCCSLVFTAFHFTSHEPIWALSVLVPSLLFGYFRDRHNSVYPSIALHIFYNAVYFILPMLLGIRF